MRHLMVALVAAVFGLTVQAAAADGPVYVKEGLFGSWDYALNGYDPVSYFTDGGPTKGQDDLTYQWNGAEWTFASADNLAAFKENPEKYAPAYGGYCAYAVSQGGDSGGDPEVWTIHQGRLYLNYSRSVQKKWDQDRDGYIEKADQNWPEAVQ